VSIRGLKLKIDLRGINAVTGIFINRHMASIGGRPSYSTRDLTMTHARKPRRKQYRPRAVRAPMLVATDLLQQTRILAEMEART